MLPKQPPLHIFNVGTNDKNGQDAELVEYYARYGFNAFYMKSGFVNGGHDYETEKKEMEIDRFSAGILYSLTFFFFLFTSSSRRVDLL